MVNISIKGQILTFPERKPGIPMQRFNHGDQTNPQIQNTLETIQNTFPNFNAFQQNHQVGASLWPREIELTLQKHCLNALASKRAAEKLNRELNASKRTSPETQFFHSQGFTPGGNGHGCDSTQTGLFGTGPGLGQ